MSTGADAGADARTNYLNSGGSNGARTLVGLLIGVVLVVAAAFLFAPGAIQDMLTSGSSEVEDMQTTSTDPGLDTDFPDLPDIETEPTEAAATMEAEETPDTSAAEQRIAALEAQLEALRAARNDEDLDALLERQAERLQEQFERERRLLQEQLDAERNREPIEVRQAGIIPSMDMGETEEERLARERLEEERARRAAIREEQINSPSVVVDGAANVSGAGGNAGIDGSGSSRKLSDREQFMADASTQGHETAQAGRIPRPSQTIVQGTTVQAVLETAVSSELPGVIRAVVARDVYSYDGANVLLPKGTRLIGEYNSDVSVVQERVQMAWSRAITPSGVSVELGGFGADRLGRSGQTGFVDSRFRERFGSAALISLIGAGPQVLISENASENEQDVAVDVGDDLESASQGAMADYLAAGPVIYVDQGTELTVFVNRDLVF